MGKLRFFAGPNFAINYLDAAFIPNSRQPGAPDLRNFEASSSSVTRLPLVGFAPGQFTSCTLPEIASPPKHGSDYFDSVPDSDNWQLSMTRYDQPHPCIVRRPGHFWCELRCPVCQCNADYWGQFFGGVFGFRSHLQQAHGYRLTVVNGMHFLGMITQLCFYREAPCDVVRHVMENVNYGVTFDVKIVSEIPEVD